MEPPKLPVREQGPETGLVSSLKYYSKTRIDKNRRRTPSDAHPTSQQKRHLLQGALKNGGTENFDGLPVLRRSVLFYNPLFIRQLTGKNRYLKNLSIGFCGLVEIPALLRKIAA